MDVSDVSDDVVSGNVARANCGGDGVFGGSVSCQAGLSFVSKSGILRWLSALYDAPGQQLSCCNHLHRKGQDQGNNAGLASVLQCPMLSYSRSYICSVYVVQHVMLV